MSRTRMIFGRKEKGKTTLAYHLARLTGKAIFAFDPNNRFDCATIARSRMSLFAATESVEQNFSPVAYRPSESIAEGIEEFSEIMLGLRGLAIIIDEAGSSEIQSPNYLNPKLHALLRASGDNQLSHDVILTQHRPQNCNGDTFELSDEYIFFSSKNHLTIKKIREHCSEEVAARVMCLEGREYLVWSVTGESFYINKDSDSWRETLSRTELDGAQLNLVKGEKDGLTCQCA